MIVTNGGTGYTTAPVVTPSGGGGSGAAFTAVVYQGVVTAVRITGFGSGYTTAPSLGFSGGGGASAAATSVIQPQTAVLVKEDMRELPESDPLRSRYVQVTRVFETLPGPSLTGKVLSGDAQGEIVNTTKQSLIASAADYSPSYLTLAWSDQPLDSVKKERNVVTAPSFPVLYDYDVDPETFSAIVTSYQVVDASTAEAATCEEGVITSYRHIDKWRSLKTIVTYSTPATYNEQRFGAQNFPNLFDYLQYYWSDTCGAFSELRGAFSAMVEIRTEISFSIARETITGLTLIPKYLMMGKGVITPNDLLVDSGSFSYSGDCTGTVTFTGSSPTYSVYMASIINTEQLISGESVHWKAGLYRNTRMYVTML